MKSQAMSASENTAALLAPLTQLKGVGPRVAGLLKRLDLRTVQDVLLHLPRAYQDRTHVTPLNQLRPGDQVVIEGEITEVALREGRRRSLLVGVSDARHTILLRFFYFTASQQAQFSTGGRVRCFGEVRAGPHSLELVHPEYRLLRTAALTHDEATLTPIYPATEGISQRLLRDLTTQALTQLERYPPEDGLPEGLRAPLALPTFVAALQYLHRPPPQAQRAVLENMQHPAQQRLIFEELLAHHLSLVNKRARLRQQHAPALTAGGILFQRLLATLPFQLTAAQQRVNTQITADMARTQPMVRLVQGDVGCGKTLVAACAVLQAVESGYQTAVMAPTELLAEQHALTFRRWLEPLGIAVGWLSGAVKGKARATLLHDMATGTLPVIVGTHALFQRDVAFARLGLVVVDEQHRFGVQQRLALRDKGSDGTLVPHQLIMTATPIPRTLAMVAYADLDSSVIDELPPGRTPITTVVMPATRREEIIARIGQACARGQQAYWVCPLIEESEALQCQAAQQTYEALMSALPDVRLGLVHGRLKTSAKEAAMRAFKAGETQLLVATTVIEVGVDVPNAALMIIENAERLGLAQLHQLRGRVGRGTAQASCVLLYQFPLSSLARERLAVMRRTTDGFEIARQDLRLRGPGEVLGTRQSGELRLRIADLARDDALLAHTEEIGQRLQRDCAPCTQTLIARWIGEGSRYAEV